MSESIDILLLRYAGGQARIISALSDVPPEEAIRVPPADLPGDVGRWSIHQIIVHLSDAESAMIDRMKRIIAMDEPSLLAWDEMRFIERLHYDKQSAEDAVELIGLLRRQMHRILRSIGPGTFQRIGIHNERGPQSLRDIVQFADWHLDHHLEFIGRKRKYFEQLVF